MQRSLGAIDLHFHGAFGIDLMTASPRDMNRLSQKLWEQGVSGFCATTLSTPPAELEAAVRRIGTWIRQGEFPGAIPLGIHLEGPFIHPHSCGAHPPKTLRKLDLQELESLWEASQHTLEILTTAPEMLSPPELKQLVRWAKPKGVLLSIGHSQATENQAIAAFAAGFTGVTHGWNALPFHHRAPGVMGAALGRKGTYVEIIADQVHIAPTLIDWAMKLHPQGTCWVSDCVPAAATPNGSWHRFGSLTTQYKDGACRLPNGALAGGGKLLPQALELYLREFHSQNPTQSLRPILRKLIPFLSTHPLRALGIPVRKLQHLRVDWSVGPRGKVTVSPARSRSQS